MSNGERLVDWADGEVCTTLDEEWMVSAYSHRELFDIAAWYGPDEDGFVRAVPLAPHRVEILRYPGSVFGIQLIDLTTDKVTTRDYPDVRLAGSYYSTHAYMPLLKPHLDTDKVVNTDKGSIQLTAVSSKGRLDTTLATPIDSTFTSKSPLITSALYPNPRMTTNSQLQVAHISVGNELLDADRYKQQEAARFVLLTMSTQHGVNQAQLNMWQAHGGGSLIVNFDTHGSVKSYSYHYGRLINDIFYPVNRSEIIRGDKAAIANPALATEAFARVKKFLGIAGSSDSIDMVQTWHNSVNAVRGRQSKVLDLLAVE